jgi:hypothetical protein
MLIHVHDNLKVGDLKDRFEECFQSLKIEFYLKPFRSDLHQQPISDSERIGEVRQIHEEGNLVIKSWYSVQQVVEDFKEQFGLNVEIFRADQDGWIPTYKNGQYNLRQQTEISQHGSCSLVAHPKQALDEYEYL